MRYKVIAPGRVNLIGEHLDYNDGFVLPAAIDLDLELVCEPLKGRIIKASSENFGAEETFSLDDLEPVTKTPAWIDYIKGVCWIMEKKGYPLTGASITVRSRIPIGSGLSSSAALELATATALAAANGYTISRVEQALLCQQAENEFVGVQCGIMDQFAIALGQEGNALLLDCRSLQYSFIPLKLASSLFMIIDSRKERSLGTSAYNRRREECEEAVRRISDLKGKTIKSLRDVSLDDIKAVESSLPGVIYRRSRYVVEENIRVKEAAATLEQGDLASFGYLMCRSHAGLRDLYEVSSPELDLIVETAMATPGALGARMTGAGFGGCAVALVELSAAGKIKQEIESAFAKYGWQQPLFYETKAAQGVRLA